MRDSAVIDEERFSVVVLTCLRYGRSHNIYSYATDARKRIQKNTNNFDWNYFELFATYGSYLHRIISIISSRK